MFVIANLIEALAGIAGFLLEVLFWVIVIRVVLSWANADPYNGFVKFIASVTEPLLRPFRRLVPPYRSGGWDLSPVLAALVIMFLQRFLVPTLHQLAQRMG